MSKWLVGLAQERVTAVEIEAEDEESARLGALGLASSEGDALGWDHFVPTVLSIQELD